MILRPPPSTPGVLQGGGEQLCSPKDVWRCLVRFLVVTTCLGAAAGISWVEARDRSWFCSQRQCSQRILKFFSFFKLFLKHVAFGGWLGSFIFCIMNLVLSVRATGITQNAKFSCKKTSVAIKGIWSQPGRLEAVTK